MIEALIELHSWEYRVFAKAESQLRAALKKVVDMETEDSPAFNPIAEKIVANIKISKAKKEFHEAVLDALMPRSVSELLTTDIPGINFNNQHLYI